MVLKLMYKMYDELYYKRKMSSVVSVNKCTMKCFATPFIELLTPFSDVSNELKEAKNCQRISNHSSNGSSKLKGKLVWHKRKTFYFKVCSEMIYGSAQTYLQCFN
jgi:hypothetical protein